MIMFINVCGILPKSNKGYHGLFPALLVHEKIQHDSALAEQGQSSSLHTQTSNPSCTVMMANYFERNGATVGPDLENEKTIKQKQHELCETDPLPDFGLVPLWQDVNVGLKRAGLDDSFVPGGHRDTLMMRIGSIR